MSSDLFTKYGELDSEYASMEVEEIVNIWRELWGNEPDWNEDEANKVAFDMKMELEADEEADEE